MLNKIDLPAAQPEKYAAELAHIIGCDPDDVLRVSAKTGEGVGELLDEIVRLVPHPVGDPDAPARAMIFDSCTTPTAASSPTSGSSTATCRRASGS